MTAKTVRIDADLIGQCSGNQTHYSGTLTLSDAGHMFFVVDTNATFPPWPFVATIATRESRYGVGFFDGVGVCEFGLLENNSIDVTVAVAIGVCVAICIVATAYFVVQYVIRRRHQRKFRVIK